MITAPLEITESDRSRPSRQFIDAMRERYPTEREIDRMLTRKLQRRALPPYSVVDLDNMTAYLAALLEANVDGPFEITGQRWLAGGASKIQMGFTLAWEPPGTGRTTTDMVVRMEPAESINATSRRREAQVLTAVRGVVPVPEVYWVDTDGDWFPEPALVYEFARGVTKPRRTSTGAVSGIGTVFGPELRNLLAPQFVEHIARIHTFDHEHAELDAFDRPEVGTTQTALWQLNRARRVWEEDRTQDFPLVEVAANWLEANLPELDKVSLIHGDYRSGNFLYDEADAQIVAWLDWERGYLGDRHRDLAWTTARSFGSPAEDGRTFLASGLLTVEQFLHDYEERSGLEVDPERLRYYRIFNSYQLVVAAIGSAQRVALLGKSHQDVMLASVQGVGYVMAEQLRHALEEIV
jgi:aminoglycoside phosphotransferase (APT) family kinase protein